MLDGATLDLGDIDGPVLVFGGPYGNLQATAAMRAEARRLGIAPAQTICTGDIVAYCGDPAETVALMRRWGPTIVMGNVEERVGAGAADCGCGFAPGSACDVLSRDWFAHVSRRLEPETARWMGARPAVVRLRMAGRDIAVVHASPASLSEFVFASTPDMLKRRHLDALCADVVVGGHCGLPFTVEVGRRVWHNAGVVGMPANDGTTDGWYSILKDEGGVLSFEHRRLAYDSDGAIDAMRGNGLPDAYARTLGDGLWPNMDILPEVERALRGRPIEAATFRLPQR